MFHKLDEFFENHGPRIAEIRKNFDNLTDESLQFVAYENGPTIGWVAWHLVQTVSEMMQGTGLSLADPPQATPPASAAFISEQYQQAHDALDAAIRANWTDADLQVADEMYGMQWKRGLTLSILMGHEYHHHGQLTVMMRCAGLPVAGIFGPAREEWEPLGMTQPH